MAHIALQPRVADDLERIADHLKRYEAADISARIESIIQAMNVLESNPFIGRPANDGYRELIIGKGAQGYVARYLYLDALDTVLILNIRAQREAGYRE